MRIPTALIAAILIALPSLALEGPSLTPENVTRLSTPAGDPIWSGDRVGLINDGSFEDGECGTGSAWTCVSTTTCQWIVDPTGAWGYPAYDGILAAWIGGFCGGDASEDMFCQDIYFDGRYLDWWWMGFVNDVGCSVIEVRIDGNLVWERPMTPAEHTYGTWTQASDEIAAPFGVDVEFYAGSTHELCIGNVNSGCGEGLGDNMLVDYFTLSEPFEITVFPDGSGAYPSIQAALDAVSDDGTVYLADGVFEGPGNSQIIWPSKTVSLQSHSLIPENCVIRINEVILTPRDSGWRRGQARPSGKGRDVLNFGIKMDGCCPAGSEITGIAFENGYADFSGGAILVQDTSPIISDCLFRDCYSEGEGGALVLYTSSAQVLNCRFENNFSMYGGAICVGGEFSDPLIDNCYFYRNIGSDYSGAVDIYNLASSSIFNCVFLQNEAYNAGGALSSYANCFADVQHSTFAENIAPNVGGGVFCSGDMRFWFNIIAFSESGGAFFYESAFLHTESLDLACCDFFGNVDGDWVDEVAGLLGVDGNFSADPQFCGIIGNGNLELQSDSPCLPAHNDCGQLIGALPDNCGESASRPTSWSELKQLY